MPVIRAASMILMAATFATILVGSPALAENSGPATTIRVGILQYGTVNWELDAMTRNGLDAKNGVTVEIVPLAGEEASNVALQAGSVDMVVSDWLWVSRQRATGADFTFVPYSTSVGSIMVPADSDVKTLSDLKNKTIGVAGGPLDKNWLLIQALAREKYGVDLTTADEIVYAAPPLLNAKVQSGELDAVLNYWHYCARLEAQGFRVLLTGTEAAMAMGANGPVAAIGWTFRDAFAEEHAGAIEGFMAADAATKDLLATSDSEWEALRPLVRAEDDRTFEKLRERYREGIPGRSASDERADTERLYRLLAEIGGERLVGPGKTLAKGTYWSPADANGGRSGGAAASR